MKLFASSLILPLLLFAAPAQTTVFSTDFDGTAPAPQILAGAAVLTGVQGYAGLGPANAPFAGNFLRSPTGNVVSLTLDNLPPHNAIQLDFLFAAIDSLDGTGAFPSGDFFVIEIDGNTFFRESFANALLSQIQSYQPPAGVTLSRMIDLGFTGPGHPYTDSAYWLGGDPLFQAIGHTASSVTIRMVMEGPGIQPLSDESWAIDCLTVRVLQATNPGTVIAYGASCGPVLSAPGSPSVGGALTAFLANLPANAVLTGLAFGISDAPPAPISLTPFGAPGCFVHHDLVIAETPMLLQLPVATSTTPIPALTGFAGYTFFAQAWVVAPGVNPLNVLTSNGLRVVIGQ